MNLPPTPAKKVAILYIATGRYRIFWTGFYRACQRYFLPGYSKTYFVFSDDPKLGKGKKNVINVPQEKLDWPFITLMRFKIFLGVEEELKNYDYIFFLNANMIPIAPVGPEVLPTQEQGLIVSIHPGFYDKPRERFTYETNPASTAYISRDQGVHYVMGGFNGGTSQAALQAYRDMHANTEKDLANDIIAIWHDESHLNKYILDKDPLILGPEYNWIEELLPVQAHLSINPKILMLDKSSAKYGGHNYLRGISNKRKNRLSYYLAYAKESIRRLGRKILGRK